MSYRKFELIMSKQKEYLNLTKALCFNESLLKRFKQHAILNGDNLLIDFEVEDTLTGKIYKNESYQQLIKNITTDLRKEKIAKILAI